VSEHTTNTALRLRPPAHRVSRRAIGYWTAMASISWIVVIGILTAIVVTSDDPPAFLTVALVVACVVGPLHLIVMPQWRYRVHRWEVTGDAVYTLTGWLTRTWTLVPIARIQTVDVTRGVLQQLFGLSTVAVMTASSQGTVQVWHLEADVAQQVADDLAHRAEQVRDQAT